MILQIIIPTYNRSQFLAENLRLLASMIRVVDKGLVGIVVSDNASPDESQEVCRKFAIENPDIEFIYNRNGHNVGAEPNMLRVLELATAKFVMYLGDDDYLPLGYIGDCIEIIMRDAEVAFIAASYANLLSDGSYLVKRPDIRTRVYSKGMKAVLLLSGYAHQMSGLVFLREGIYEGYMRGACRNLYPFIQFAIEATLRGRGYYLGGHVVIVWDSNKKDWAYDASGLLSDCLLNYTRFFSGWRLVLAQLVFVYKQQWRMRLGFRRPLLFLSALKHFFASRAPHRITKIITPVLVPLAFVHVRSAALLLRPRARIRRDLLAYIGRETADK